jgi:hypothetical protein
MCTVSYCCTAAAIETASKVGAFLIANILFAFALVAAGAIQSE